LLEKKLVMASEHDWELVFYGSGRYIHTVHGVVLRRDSISGFGTGGVDMLASLSMDYISMLSNYRNEHATPL
jgi:hypothetical protein